MDHYSAFVLRCKHPPSPSRIFTIHIAHPLPPPRFLSTSAQVALFLLLMPIIAAPLEALAVLGTSLSHNTSVLNKIIPLRLHDICFSCLLHMNMHIHTMYKIAFVLAGIPVYYLTRRPDSEGASRVSSLLCTFSFSLSPSFSPSHSPSHYIYPALALSNYTLFFIPKAPLNALVSRLRGSGLSRAGWTRVATAPEAEGEGESAGTGEVEMSTRR